MSFTFELLGRGSGNVNFELCIKNKFGPVPMSFEVVNILHTSHNAVTKNLRTTLDYFFCQFKKPLVLLKVLIF